MVRSGGAGTAGQGNAGGTTVGDYWPGGGGGSGGAAYGSQPNNPGIGTSSSISGSAVTYAAGDDTGGEFPNSGAANTGNGGEGANISYPKNGANGGSGIVIVKYLTTSVTGRLGQALSFDGSTQYTSVADTSSLKPTAAISYGGWVYVPSAPGGLKSIMEKGTASTAGYGLYVTSDPKFCFVIKTAGGTETNAGPSITTGAWHHVMVTYDSTTPTLYIDGASQSLASGTGCTASTNAGAITQDTSTLVMGARGAGASQFFTGNEDDMRVYNRALSATEVKMLYNYTGAYNPVASPGKVKQAMYFDGTNDYVSVADATALELGSGDFTIDFFAKFDDVASTRGLVSKWGATGGSTLSYALDWVTGTNQLRFHCSSDGAADTAYNQSFTPAVGGWYHITIVRSGSALRHYVDGVQLGSDLSISGGCFDSNRPLLIGATDIGGGSFSYHDGAIDEVRIYSRALTGSEIIELGGARQVKINSSQNTLITDGLTGQWSFDGGDMSTTTGLSATGGTITTDGNYKVHTFTSSGTFTVTSGSGDVEYLVVAGGGGGGQTIGGGGGAGGYLTATGFAVTTQAYTVTVGAGGAGAPTTNCPGGDYASGGGTSGSNSVFGSITATGGGGGGNYNHVSNGASTGGSGGGIGAGSGASSMVGTSGQGNAGGVSSANTNDGAGGGGAGAVGGNASSGTAGAGGAGLANSISGSSIFYSGGGGGGARNPNGGAGGAGGSSVGGAGGAGFVAGSAGTANRGGGGGGGGYDSSLTCAAGGSGGSGIVIVRYLTGTNIANDTSGNGKNGTLTNGPTAAIGKTGQALDFDGTNDYISVGNVGSINSVSFWMKADGTTKKIIDLNGTAYVEVSSGTITATGFTSPTIYVDGAVASTIDTDWHHVVITTSSTITASAVDIGKVSSGYFDGRLDDVRMYSRALSASEIQTLYRSGT
ncbi:MAG: LamG domain-containing protein [Candidatus Moraniibacteriota bacterium]